MSEMRVLSGLSCMDWRKQAHACSLCCQALVSLAPLPVSQHHPAAPVRDLSLQICDEGNVSAEAFPPLRVQLLQLFHLCSGVALTVFCICNAPPCLCSSCSSPHRHSL